MNHNLSDKKTYPYNHLWLTSNYINIYTQGLPIKIGDEVCIEGKEYEVLTCREENVAHSIDTSHNNPARPYLTDQTRFFVCQINREVQFKMTDDRAVHESTEFRIPTQSRGSLHANI